MTQIIPPSETNQKWECTSRIFRHWKGGLYTLLFESQNADNNTDRKEMIVYVSHSTGQIYCRSKEEFFELVSSVHLNVDDGTGWKNVKVQRFTELTHPTSSDN